MREQGVYKPGENREDINQDKTWRIQTRIEQGGCKP